MRSYLGHLELMKTKNPSKKRGGYVVTPPMSRGRSDAATAPPTFDRPSLRRELAAPYRRIKACAEKTTPYRGRDMDSY
jgi:hypothetical protein